MCPWRGRQCKSKQELIQNGFELLIRTTRRTHGARNHKTITLFSDLTRYYPTTARMMMRIYRRTRILLPSFCFLGGTSDEGTNDHDHRSMIDRCHQQIKFTMTVRSYYEMRMNQSMNQWISKNQSTQVNQNGTCGRFDYDFSHTSSPLELSWLGFSSSYLASCSEAGVSKKSDVTSEWNEE